MTTVRAKRIKKIKLALTLANTTRQYESLLAHSLRQEAEVRDLRRNEEHCRSALTGGHAGTATDTGGSVEGAVGISLGNRNHGCFRSGTGVDGNEAASLDNTVESGTVHGAVTDNRECSSAPRFDHDGVTILELPFSLPCPASHTTQIFKVKFSPTTTRHFSFGRFPLRESGYILWVARFTPFPSNLIKRSLAP